MVVKADELESRLKRKNAQTLNQLEKKIDEQLEQKFQVPSQAVYVGLDFTSLPTCLRESLFDRYRAQGWEVQYNTSQLDGDYAEFEMIKPSSCSGGQAYSVGGPRPYD